MILIMTGKQTFIMYKKRENYHVKSRNNVNIHTFYVGKT